MSQVLVTCKTGGKLYYTWSLTFVFSTIFESVTAAGQEVARVYENTNWFFYADMLC